MSYTRVIPRDFFNEAKLLKCMGQLSLAVLDCMVPEGIKIEIEEKGEPFEIELTGDGSLLVNNYVTRINGATVVFSTRYNSKRAFPFYCQHPETLEDVEVFDDAGKFTEEFVTTFAAKL